MKRLNELSVVYIPSYIVTALENERVTLNEIASLWSGLSGDDSGMRQLFETTKMIHDRISDILSKHDLTTFARLTTVLSTHMYGYNLRGNAMGHNAINYIMDISESNHNPDILLRDILNEHNGNNTMSVNINDVVKFRKTDNTLFVILHDGSSKFFINNTNEYRREFDHILINNMFGLFGEDAVLQSTQYQAIFSNK